MAIPQFAAELIEELGHGSINTGLRTEQALERHFVIPIAKRLANRHPDILIFTHPFRGTRRCTPECASTPPAPPGRIIGCPTCWAKSKSWASVAAFGTHHTFDLVRGVTLSLAWDGGLLAISLNPEEYQRRKRALSFVGMASDTATDVAENHDKYLWDAADAR